MNQLRILFLILTFNFYQSNAQIKILFDATKAETAGNADWVIDADLTNLNWTTASTVTTGGKKANAQRFPTPDQSTITTSTPETYWTGSLSSWGIDCVNEGYNVESLPYNGRITYGDSTNAQDLNNYKVFVVDEPNILFTSAEKTAMLNFVENGGGLFIISDHSGSDRNNDGYDSPTIWDDFFTNNGKITNPFGIHFFNTSPNVVVFPADFSETTTHLLSNPNPISQGTYGKATKLKYSNGTSMILDTVANPTVKGVVFANESSSIIDGVMFAYAKYGKGKIVATGDSSPSDDGTGSKGYTIYTSYKNDPVVGDNHRFLYMNSTIWLATTDTTLPVKFIYVNGENENDFTTINWEVNETNLKGEDYQVERSIDGMNYTIAGENFAKNKDGNLITNYQWQTNETITKKIYYRIKTTENGKVIYSETVAINPINNNKIRIYPNPQILSNQNKFTISGLTIGNSITITDIRGIVCYKEISTGSSIVLDITNKMTEGVYIVTIRDGNSLTTKKLLISK